MVDILLKVKVPDTSKKSNEDMSFLDKLDERIRVVEGKCKSDTRFEWEWLKAIYCGLRDCQHLGAIGKHALEKLEPVIKRGSEMDPVDGGTLLIGSKLHRWMD